MRSALTGGRVDDPFLDGMGRNRAMVTPSRLVMPGVECASNGTRRAARRPGVRPQQRQRDEMIPPEAGEDAASRRVRA